MEPRYAIHHLKHLKECFAKFIVLLQTGGYRGLITLPNSSESGRLFKDPPDSTKKTPSSVQSR